MTPLPWSHSALSDFLNCPKAYYHKRIAKDVVDPPNPAGLWGDYVHKQFQLYLEGELDALPSDIEQYTDYLEAIKLLPGDMRVECKYALSKKVQPCTFFAKDVWCRAIIDVLHINGDTARALDHKTGKRKPDSRQLKLTALMVLAHHPEINTVKTAYFWLTTRERDSETYTRDQWDELWGIFLPDLYKYKEAANLMAYNPKPSGLCNGWCPVHTCEYWKPKRGT